MRGPVAAAAVVALVLACKGKGGGAGPGSGSGSGSAIAQSFGEAIAILCGKTVQPPSVRDLDPGERDHVVSQWLEERILNARARAVLAALNTDPDPATTVIKVAAEAGVADCRPLAMFASRRIGGIVVPVLAETGSAQPLDQDLPLVTVSTTEIEVEATRVAAVAGDGLDAAGADKVAAAIRALRASAEHAHTHEVVIAIDASLSSSVLGSVLMAITTGGIHDVSIAVRVGREAGAVILQVPYGAAIKSPPAGVTAVRMFVAIVDGEVVVASASGQEGTLAQPLVRVPLQPLPAAAAAVRDALAGVISRRWPGHAARGPFDSDLTVVATAPVSVQVLVELIATANVAPDGTALFAAVDFARGID